jgi:predicted Rossmann fold flavoprotein
MITTDVIILGAGAAGLMCAIEAGKRGRQTIVLDHSNKPGKKILMSGGGRCNFTNYNIHPDCYLSHNPHFCKSALSRYTQWDFIELVKRYQIPFHEKTLGQLFCDNKAKDILNMLLTECALVKATIRQDTSIEKIKRLENGRFQLDTTHGSYSCESLVIATGGLSIPTLGASPFGYRVAEQFDIKVWPTRAGLVPFTLHDKDKQLFSELAGVAIDTVVQHEQQQFRENTLFTHRGLSGPAILQISSYWQPGNDIHIDMVPDKDLMFYLRDLKQHSSKQLKTVLAEHLPKRLLEMILPAELAEKPVPQLTEKNIEAIATLLHTWRIKPNATEGYRTAEVTLGGVDCDALSSKTMEARNTPGLYFIGEVVDVSGWLGGYNFQWAWSSGWAAGQAV